MDEYKEEMIKKEENPPDAECAECARRAQNRRDNAGWDFPTRKTSVRANGVKLDVVRPAPFIPRIIKGSKK